MTRSLVLPLSVFFFLSESIRVSGASYTVPSLAAVGLMGHPAGGGFPFCSLETAGSGHDNDSWSKGEALKLPPSDQVQAELRAAESYTLTKTQLPTCVPTTYPSLPKYQRKVRRYGGTKEGATRGKKVISDVSNHHHLTTSLCYAMRCDAMRTFILHTIHIPTNT